MKKLGRIKLTFKSIQITANTAEIEMNQECL